MNRGTSLWGMAALALAVAAAPALGAQGRGFEGGMGHFGGMGMRTPVTGAPYSATMTTTRVQKLEDGTTITHTSVVNVARDSQGRIYREALPETPGRTIAVYSVFDPVARLIIHWTSNSKQASLMHLPDPSQFAASRWAQGPRPEDRPETGNAVPGSRFHGNLQPATVASLGSKIVDGLVADGTSSTRIIPAGAQGNDQPIVITHESWVSSDLKIEVMRTDSDPRFGTTTMEMSNISRAEPAASLFQAPAGYAVEEHTPGLRGPSAVPLR
jgi:hypothetical protein